MEGHDEGRSHGPGGPAVEARAPERVLRGISMIGGAGGWLPAYVAGGASLVLLWTILVLSAGAGDRSGEKADDRSPGIAETVPEERRPQPPDGGTPAGVSSERSVVAQRKDADRLPEGGATHEPGGYDPLGFAGESGGLTETDKGRVRLAAARFIAAAYGYSGERGTQRKYLSAVNDSVLSPEFYGSPGGDQVRRYAEGVAASGTESAAKLTGFEVRGVTDGVVEGRAHFETGDAYDDHGDLEGERRAYRQELTLERRGAVFRVKAAGEVEGA